MLSDSRRTIARLRRYAGPAVFLACAGITYGCEPDLDSLKSKYDPLGNAGKGGTGGSGDGSGGKDVRAGTGSGGDPMADAGSGGDSSSAPACENGRQGEDESDVDCGGSSDCDRCDNGKKCSEASDCKSDFCSSEGTCDEPGCDDGEQNQNETDVDCGGSCGKKCELGAGCSANGDCLTGYCNGDNECADHCESGKSEADETDTDCGGETCGGCEVNRRCSKPSDCLSGICSNKVCAAPSCGDEIKNQDESDVDCGGVCALEKPCEIGERCNAAIDCASYVCGTKGVCNADLEIPDDAWIDNMEDANLAIDATNGRRGTWYAFGDGTGTVSYAMSTIPGTRGASSLLGLHGTAKDFKQWGSGLGFDFDQPGTTTTSKKPYDVSNYIGITFWARAASATTMSVVFPDKNTDPAGGICTETEEFEGKCDHHWLTNVVFTTEWKRHTIEFSKLVLEAGGMPVPEAPALDGLISVQFRASGNVDYDVWIDDVAFLSSAP